MVEVNKGEAVAKGTLLWLVILIGALGASLVAKGEYTVGVVLLVIAVVIAMVREVIKPYLERRRTKVVE